MSITNSPNMLLPVPTVGQEPGPQFATDINNCMALIDAHDHTPGRGVQLTPASFNINSDVTFQDNNLTFVRSVRFQPQPSPLSGIADIGSVYVSGADLYYNDTLGNQVRITQSGAVAGTPGSIANLVPPASASYVSANQTFVWQSAANTPANMDFASAILRNLVANSHGLTLNPPNAMGADYALTLPTLPATQSFMTLDASGNMGAPWTVDGTTIVISSNQLKVATNVTLPGNVNTSGTLQENGKYVVVSNTNAAGSLAMVRGTVNSDGTIKNGEGFTSSQISTGLYQITFTTAFADEPSVVGSIFNSGAATFSYFNKLSTGFQAAILIDSGAGANDEFNFIAIGLRA